MELDEVEAVAVAYILYKSNKENILPLIIINDIQWRSQDFSKGGPIKKFVY